MRKVLAGILSGIMLLWQVQPSMATEPKKAVEQDIIFCMKDTSGDFVTGLSVTASVSKDGGAIASSTNAVSEVGLGLYKLTLTTTEMNGDVVAVRCAAAGAKSTAILLYNDDYTQADIETLVDGVEGALVTAQADLDNPDQYKADVSSLATTAHLQEVEDKIDLISTATPSTLTAQQVWEYGTRTITSGLITAADVWAYATRTLSAFAFTPSISATSLTNITTEVRNAITTDHGTGSYTDASSPTGVNTVTLQTTITGTSTGIPGSVIYVYDSLNTTLLWELTTATSPAGQKTVSMSNGTYKLRVYKPGYTADAVPETLTVLGDTASTYYMSALSSGSPISVDACRVTINLLDQTGTYYSDQVVVAKFLRYAEGGREASTGGIIANISESKTTDANGQVYFDLPQGAIISFTFQLAADKFTETKTIPNTSTANYQDL